MIRLLLILIALSLCVGCQGTVSRIRQPLQNEGAIVLYLQPFPQEAQRLDLTLAGIVALRDDGVSFPLELRLARLNSENVGRQRFLAEGELPPGNYRGFAFKVSAATLLTEEGTAALLPPEQDGVTDFHFSVKARQATLATLTLNFRETVRDEFRITPSFTALTPPRPLATLTGYVTNTGSHTISVFDKKAAEVAGVIATGNGPAAMVLDQRQHRAYVALSGEDAIEIIDTTTDTVLNRIPLSVGDEPKHLAITPDGKTLLAVNSGSNSVSFVDPFSLAETSRVDVGNGPESIIIDGAGRQAYIFNYLAGSMSVIDIGSRIVTATIALEAGPLRGQFNRKGDQLLVLHGISPNLLVMDTATLRVIRRIPVGIGTSTHKVDSMTDLLYVGMKGTPVVSIYLPFSLLENDNLKAGGSPGLMTVDGELGTLLCLLPAERALSIVNLVGKKQTGILDLGDDPFWVTVNGER